MVVDTVFYSISGCTDHFGESEEKSIEMTKQIIASLNQPDIPTPKGYNLPNELSHQNLLLVIFSPSLFHLCLFSPSTTLSLLFLNISFLISIFSFLFSSYLLSFFSFCHLSSLNFFPPFLLFAHFPSIPHFLLPFFYYSFPPSSPSSLLPSFHSSFLPSFLYLGFLISVLPPFLPPSFLCLILPSFTLFLIPSSSLPYLLSAFLSSTYTLSVNHSFYSFCHVYLYLI